jgi:hypothetical protein
VWTIRRVGPDPSAGARCLTSSWSPVVGPHACSADRAVPVCLPERAQPPSTVRSAAPRPLWDPAPSALARTSGHGSTSTSRFSPFERLAAVESEVECSWCDPRRRRAAHTPAPSAHRAIDPTRRQMQMSSGQPALGRLAGTIAERVVQHMRRPTTALFPAIVAGAFVLAACGSSSPSSPTTSTTAIAPAAALATGSYAPAGSDGTPHYVVDITSAQGTRFSGNMTFLFQDGRTSREFDFSGAVTGQSATATPTSVATSNSEPKTVSSVPSSLRISVGPDMLTFEDCQTYLPEAQSAGACTFSQSR